MGVEMGDAQLFFVSTCYFFLELFGTRRADEGMETHYRRLHHPPVLRRMPFQPPPSELVSTGSGILYAGLRTICTYCNMCNLVERIESVWDYEL